MSFMSPLQMNILFPVTSFFYFQLYKHAIGQQNETYLSTGALSIQALLNNWLAFSDKVPKGFGKYFNDDEPKSNKSDEVSAKDRDTKEETPKSKSKPKPSGTDDYFDLRKLFFTDRTKSGGGSGKPIGGNNNEREKWFSAAMLGAALLFGGIAYYSYAYKEINWKEFAE